MPHEVRVVVSPETPLPKGWALVSRASGVVPPVASAVAAQYWVVQPDGSRTWEYGWAMEVADLWQFAREHSDPKSQVGGGIILCMEHGYPTITIYDNYIE